MPGGRLAFPRLPRAAVPMIAALALLEAGEGVDALVSEAIFACYLLSVRGGAHRARARRRRESIASLYFEIHLYGIIVTR